MTDEKRRFLHVEFSFPVGIHREATDAFITEMAERAREMLDCDFPYQAWSTEAVKQETYSAPDDLLVPETITQSGALWHIVNVIGDDEDVDTYEVESHDNPDGTFTITYGRGPRDTW